MKLRPELIPLKLSPYHLRIYLWFTIDMGNLNVFLATTSMLEHCCNHSNWLSLCKGQEYVIHWKPVFELGIFYDVHNSSDNDINNYNDVCL